ncbi:hypothetical protein [Nesterenkonia sp. F]|uniref:hypothetical protein n=1 Tax=Nesterenkonia sp. F TaxID=795955 RepID=UPI000255CF9B|nr:hypothetical protein [Nesterenkonia sp. F]
MDASQRLEHPQFAAALEIPQRWEVDLSGIGDGLVIVGDDRPWSMGFVPTVVFTQAPLGQEHSTDPAAVLDSQRIVESTLAEQLRDLRPLHLDVDTFGFLGEQQVHGVMRVASYTTAEAVPVMMHQWVARCVGVELSMTVTYPTVDMPTWSEGGWSLANTLEWTGVS